MSEETENSATKLQQVWSSIKSTAKSKTLWKNTGLTVVAVGPPVINFSSQWLRNNLSEAIFNTATWAGETAHAINTFNVGELPIESSTVLSFMPGLGIAGYKLNQYLKNKTSDTTAQGSVTTTKKLVATSVGASAGAVLTGGAFAMLGLPYAGIATLGGMVGGGKYGHALLSSSGSAIKNAFKWSVLAAVAWGIPTESLHYGTQFYDNKAEQSAANSCRSELSTR